MLAALRGVPRESWQLGQISAEDSHLAGDLGSVKGSPLPWARALSAGELQINYFVYPRMIATAARAWAELFPGDDFRRHLVITSGFAIMPTFLVKRSEWAPGEIAEVRRFIGPEFPDVFKYQVIYAPGEPEAGNVPDEFFRVPLPRGLVDALPYKVFPPTDDRPFFRDLRKKIEPLTPDGQGYVTADTAGFLNPSLRGGVPMESVHLYFPGALSVAVAGVVVLVPLLWSRRRGLRVPGAGPTLAYFACLGAGFVIVELALMSKFVLLVGYPIYSMAAVLFTLLVAAGAGSYLSAPLERAWGRWAILVIPAFGLVMIALIAVFPRLRDLTLGMGQGARVLLVMAFLVPIGVPMGMPFPLGVAALDRRAPALIPWAWGVNGFMTVVGSLLAVVLSMKVGFDQTLLAAVAIYLVAVPSFLLLTKDSSRKLDGEKTAAAAGVAGAGD